MKINCFKNVSAKCTAAVMAASMVLTPVAGALAFPMGIYAVDYQSTADIPADDSGHKNLTSADTLAYNDGTIEVNAGKIEVNAGTVNVNALTGIIEDNYGDVNENNGRVDINHTNGEVTYGTVTDNYGDAANCQVTNNYASGTVTGGDSNVTNNWGTVTDVASVTNNCGTVIDNLINGETTVTYNWENGRKEITPIEGEPYIVEGEEDGPDPAQGKRQDPAPTVPQPQQTQPDPGSTTPAQQEHQQAENDASRRASNSPNSAVTVQYAAEGLALSPELLALFATTPEQALILAQAAVLDPVALSGGAALVTASCDPATIALAKAEVLFDPAVINSLKNLRIGSQYGTPNVTGAGTVSASDGRAIKSQTVNIECPGLTSAKGVAVLVYTLNANGTKSVKVIKPRFSKGKLKVQLPVPCEYVIVQNVAQ